MPEPQTPQTPQAPPQTQQQNQTIVIRVGLHCEGCRRKVKKALSTVPGIEELKVDLKEQKVTIRGAVDVKRVMSKLARTGKANELLTNTPTPPPDANKPKESPAPGAGAPAGGTPAPAAASTPVSLSTSAAATEAAILKEMPLKPMVFINAPDFLSDENPNACSIM